MAKLQTRLAVIEETLAESRLYTDENKSELTQLLQERGDIQSSLEELEMEWLEIQEQIETVRNAAEEQ